MKTSLLGSKAIRGVTAVLVVVTLAIGGIGFLHTPMGRKLPIGRKLLALMGMKCPIDFSRMSATEVEASFQRGVHSLSGKYKAPARPALAGLELDATTEAEAMKWANERSIHCRSEVKGMRFLKCGDNPANMLTLAFTSQGKLVAVDIFQRKLSPDEASKKMNALSAHLISILGPPSDQKGALTAAHLSGETMKTAYMNFRFRNYLALLTATNIPWSGGVAVHEQYSSVLNP